MATKKTQTLYTYASRLLYKRVAAGARHTHTHTHGAQSSSARQKSPTRVCAADPEPHLARKVRDQAVRAYCTVKPLCESITAVNAEPEASMYLTFTREAATEEESPPLAWSPQVTTLPSSLIAANATWFA